MAILIKTDGTNVEVNPKNGKDFKFEELYKLIGGYIEIVRLSNKEILVCDEEGLCKQLPINVEASLLAGRGIVGDVVLCKDNQVL